MKKTLLFVMAAAASASLWAQNKEYKIEISVSDAQKEGKYVLRTKDLPEKFSDTITLKKDGEKVTFKKPFNTEGYLLLGYIKPGENKSGNSAELFISSPTVLKVSAASTADLPAPQISGGIYDKPALKAFAGKMSELYKTVLAYQEVGKENNKPKTDSIIAVYERIYGEIGDMQKEYVKAETADVYSAALLSGMMRNEELNVIEPLYNALSADVKASRYGKNIAEKLDVIRAIQVGKPAPDFALNDIDGNVIKLSDHKGKWVLLDFWGSWCIWCRRGNPGLVELYDKYGGKDFEIIGLAARDKVEAWKKAIADDGLTWRHAYLSLTEGGDKLPEKYNVSGYPTKILVDPDGNIAVISVGYHEKDDPVALKLIESLGEVYVK